VPLEKIVLSAYIVRKLLLMAEASFFFYRFEVLLFMKNQEFVLFLQVLFLEVQSNEIVIK